MHTTNLFSIVTSEGYFDGDTHYREPTSFLVKNGKIDDIREGDHSDEMNQNGINVTHGGFLLPGLVDSHVHLFLDGLTTDGANRSAHMKKPREKLFESALSNARNSLEYGITLVRDAGDKHGINHDIRSQALTHGADLCHVRSGGMGIKRPKRYGAFMARDVEDNKTIQDIVLKQAEDTDEIKLILTGIIDFEAGAVTDEPQFDLEAARLVVDTAKTAGRKTFAHCSGRKGLTIAANAGVGSVEHGFFMDREILSMMRDNQVAWTPTFCPVHFQWAVPEAVGWSKDTVGNLRRILDGHAEHLRIAHETGVTLLLGTDAGSMGVEHGKAVFEEIERFIEAGIPLDATLAAATSAARRYFDLPDATLETGAVLEAVLLEESPFTNLKTLQTPLRVWSRSESLRR